MNIKEVIKSQYRASLAMLQQAIEKCPESLWDDNSYKNPFWRVAYHVLFYTHLYLQRTEADFVPRKKHVENMNAMSRPVSPEIQYPKQDVLAYFDFCRGEVDKQVDALDLDSESGFSWIPFDKLELQFYNIRHIMQHTGELCERLGAHGDVEVGWVGRGK